MWRRSRTCSRGGTRTCPPPSSGRCCPPESGRGTAVRGWCTFWRWRQRGAGWLRSARAWPARRPCRPGSSRAGCASARRWRRPRRPRSFPGRPCSSSAGGGTPSSAPRSGGLVLLVERANLPLQRAHGVHGLVDLVQQALALHGRVLEFAHDARDVDLFAGDEPAGVARGDTLVLAAPEAACFSSSAAIFFWCFTSASMRATVALTRACTTSSVSSSSSKITTSFMLRTPRFRSSPSATISRITMGEREMALSTRIWPRSMRLAISTSPSRVSSGTVPISRKYMRTGSLVFSSVPGVRSSSTSSPSSSSKSLSPWKFGAVEQIDALGADGGDQVVQIVGRSSQSHPATCRSHRRR